MLSKHYTAFYNKNRLLDVWCKKVVRILCRIALYRNWPHYLMIRMFKIFFRQDYKFTNVIGHIWQNYFKLLLFLLTYFLELICSCAVVWMNRPIELIIFRKMANSGSSDRKTRYQTLQNEEFFCLLIKTYAILEKSKKRIPERSSVVIIFELF